MDAGTIRELERELSNNNDELSECMRKQLALDAQIGQIWSEIFDESILEPDLGNLHKIRQTIEEEKCILMQRVGDLQDRNNQIDIEIHYKPKPRPPLRPIRKADRCLSNLILKHSTLRRKEICLERQIKVLSPKMLEERDDLIAMASEICDLRERLERVRAKMAQIENLQRKLKEEVTEMNAAIPQPAGKWHATGGKGGIPGFWFEPDPA
jgi:chromosome segregation ATPase